jgi:hypothetical protein
VVLEEVEAGPEVAEDMRPMVGCTLRRRQLLRCSRRCSPDALRTATASGSQSVTPHVTERLIKLLKMQLSLKTRKDQAVKASNQNLNYQDFKFEVPQCYLVLTDILSQQIFRLYQR